MTMSAQTRRKVFDFRGAYAPPAVASRVDAWCSKATGSCLIKSVSGGSMDLALDATSEVQNACLYMGDILPFDINQLIRVEFVAKLTASLAAAVSGVFGVAGARNDALDTVAQSAWFMFTGANTIYCETDDGTTDTDDKTTGLSLAASYRRFTIDFAEGGNTRSLPSLAQDGTSDIRFRMSNDRGALVPVARTTRFDMSAFTGNLQLYAQIQKTTGTAVGTLSILEVAVEYLLPLT